MQGFWLWKRLKIIRGLMIYQQLILQRSVEVLVPLLKKMEEIVVVERAQGAGYATIEEAAGKINPNEPDAIQPFRIALRRDGMRLATERSYVGKLKAFMADRVFRWYRCAQPTGCRL